MNIKREWGEGGFRHCFASVGVLTAISLATEPSWKSSSPVIERRGCKCEPEDQILTARSHATGSIFNWTGKVIMLVMVKEIMDDENNGEEEKWCSQWQP